MEKERAVEKEKMDLEKKEMEHEKDLMQQVNLYSHFHSWQLSYWKVFLSDPRTRFKEHKKTIGLKSL